MAGDRESELVYRALPHYPPNVLDEWELWQIASTMGATMEKRTETAPDDDPEAAKLRAQMEARAAKLAEVREQRQAGK